MTVQGGRGKPILPPPFGGPNLRSQWGATPRMGTRNPVDRAWEPGKLESMGHDGPNPFDRPMSLKGPTDPSEKGLLDLGGV